MVKLTGPGLAKQASGSLAGQLTFSNWRGKAYLKKHRKPKQPRTPNQVAMRSMLAWLSTEWHKISAVDQATWADLARAGSFSPFNAYQRENLTRFRSYKHPSRAFPAAETGAGPDTSDTFAAGGIRSIRYGFQVITPNLGWGAAASHVAGDLVQAKWSDLIHILPTTSIGVTSTTWSPLAPGDYWICYNFFTTSGKAGPSVGWLMATVTG